MGQHQVVESKPESRACPDSDVDSCRGMYHRACSSGVRHWTGSRAWLVACGTAAVLSAAVARAAPTTELPCALGLACLGAGDPVTAQQVNDNFASLDDFGDRMAANSAAASGLLARLEALEAAAPVRMRVTRDNRTIRFVDAEGTEHTLTLPNGTCRPGDVWPTNSHIHVASACLHTGSWFVSKEFIFNIDGAPRNCAVMPRESVGFAKVFAVAVDSDDSQSFDSGVNVLRLRARLTLLWGDTDPVLSGEELTILCLKV